jgi:hypothetical protein
MNLPKIFMGRDSWKVAGTKVYYGTTILLKSCLDSAETGAYRWRSHSVTSARAAETACGWVD